MTYQEAYNVLVRRLSYLTFNDDAGACEMGARACLKQIPKQPIPKGSRECFVCPMCSRPLRQPIAAHTLLSGRTVSRQGDDFCPRCGQAIKWEE